LRKEALRASNSRRWNAAGIFMMLGDAFINTARTTRQIIFTVKGRLALVA
jgi:hypothetical protein